MTKLNTGIVLVSHSPIITNGLQEMLEEMTGESKGIKIISSGGTGDGRLGTNSIMIRDNIIKLKEAENIYVFYGIGSSLLSAETAIDLLEDDQIRNKTTLVDAPLVEGSFVASVMASAETDKADILAELSLL